MAVHPAHDLIVREVRSWYTDWKGRAPGPPGTDAGEIRVQHAPFGHLRHAVSTGGRRLVLTVDDPNQVDEALDAAGEYFGTQSFEVWVDDRARADRLDGVLRGRGLHAEDNTVVLALIEPLTAATGPQQLRIAEVTDDERLHAWARVKVLGFASDERREPESESVKRELLARRAEWPIVRCDLASLAGEHVGVLAHYIGSHDQMVFNLATVPRYRRRGVAQAMLRSWVERARDAGARSMLINCDEHGEPGTLYRRLGFTDEVYWHRRYQHPHTTELQR